MRLVTFSPKGRSPRLGAVLGPWNEWKAIVDLHAVDASIPATSLDFVDRCGSLSGKTWERAQHVVHQAARQTRTRSADVHSPKDVRLHPPIAPRLLRDFLAFRVHVTRTRAARGTTVPEEWDRFPAYYNGNHLSIYGPGDTIPIPRYAAIDRARSQLVPTTKFDYEAEVGFILGLGGRDVALDRALSHLFGVTIFNDFSARDIQAQAMKIGMGPGPAKDMANALGPCIVTRDEFGMLGDQRLAVRVDGEERLNGRYNDLVHDKSVLKEGERALWTFEEMVTFVSRSQELQPGEVWGSGTIPGGCELERGDQARYLEPGSRVEIEIEGIGVLANSIANL